MAICVVAQNPKGTPEMYEQVLQHLAQSGDLPAPGAIFQVAGPAEPGWLVVSVWDSFEAFEQFLHKRLTSAWAAAGVSQGDVSFTFFTAHSFMAGDVSGAARREAVTRSG
jgi:heme-degrading monooxygenase HmoA